MAQNKCGRREAARGLSLGLWGAVWLGFIGCASEPPKPAPTVTPEQVRTHADKAFEKLKQEEQTREGASLPR
jgi:hypothetical protein